MLGRAVAKFLIEMGVKVRVALEDEDKAAAFVGNEVPCELIVFDWNDPVSVSRMLHGVDVMFYNLVRRACEYT